MIQTIITLLASGFGLWAFFKYFILIDVRIDENSFKTLYKSLENEKIFILEEEFTTNECRYPISFDALCFLKQCWFYISHQERLMNAGWNAKDFVTRIVCLRWNYKKIKNYLKSKHEIISDIPVDLLGPGFSDKIGQIKKFEITPILTNNMCISFEEEVKEVSEQKRLKTGAIFYGNPGNGKTFFIKYLAIKYNLPIKIITFTPDWTNHDLLILFSQIPKNCIVLFEDFDNYFDGRTCILGSDNKNIKFTFDIILNGLDGIYNTYENVVFVMTANDINKIDYALKNRPSRFKYLIEFHNPNLELKEKILGNKEHADKISDMNLDQLIRLKEYLDFGSSLEESLLKINK